MQQQEGGKEEIEIINVLDINKYQQNSINITEFLLIVITLRVLLNEGMIKETDENKRNLYDIVERLNCIFHKEITEYEKEMIKEWTFGPGFCIIIDEYQIGLRKALQKETNSFIRYVLREYRSLQFKGLGCIERKPITLNDIIDVFFEGSELGNNYNIQIVKDMYCVLYMNYHKEGEEMLKKKKKKKEVQ